MVHHIVMWNFKEEVAEEKKPEIIKNMEEALNGLVGQVPGLLEVTVNINGLASSNAEVMLDSTLENEEALKGYAVHPAQVEVADTKVRPYTKTRMCLDFEI